MASSKNKTAAKPAAGATSKAAAPSKTHALDTVTVSEDTLEGTPARVLSFLRAVGTVKAIRAVLLKRGYDAAEHKNGWKLLHATSGFQDDSGVVDDTAVADAVAAVDAWDEKGFRLATAALKHRHPVQFQFIFGDGLSASQGPAAVLGVQKFLDRLDELESSPGRKATRTEDLAALATLAKRGIDANERARLRGLLSQSEAFGADAGSDQPELTAEETHAALVELRAWYEEWSEIARLAISRRDYLIRLGLAQRKSPSKKKPDAPVAPPASLVGRFGHESAASATRRELLGRAWGLPERCRSFRNT